MDEHNQQEDHRLELEEIDDNLDLGLNKDGEDMLDEHAKDSENSGQDRTDKAKDTGQQLANEAENVNQEGKNLVLDNGGDEDEIDR